MNYRPAPGDIYRRNNGELWMACHCESDVWHCEVLRLNGGSLMGFSFHENLRIVYEAELLKDFVLIGELSHYLQEIATG